MSSGNTEQKKENPSGHLQNIEISSIVYDTNGGNFKENLKVEDCLMEFQEGKITWLNLDGYTEEIVKVVIEARKQLLFF